MESPKADNVQPIRVILQQPALPRYRVPVFRELSRRTGIKLTIYHGEQRGAPPSVKPDDLDVHFVRERAFHLPGRWLYWHSPQWRCATRARADVLILTWGVQYLSLIPALFRAKLSGVPTILWGHGYSKREVGWRAWIRSRVAKLATALLFYNHATMKRYAQRGFDSRRMFVALNALDQTPIQEARAHWLDRPRELAEFRKEHGLENSQIVLFVSRLDHDNRVDLLLQAASILKPSRPALKVIIVGKGEDQERLERMTEELRLKDHVRFAGAIYDETQLAPWFLSADVFCYPANIGLSMLHAFGYGVPVITSDRIESQNPEIEALRHEENGLLYAHGDANALAAAIARILDDPDLRQRMSDCALTTATERFTLANMVDGMEAAIRFCVQSAAVRDPAPAGGRSIPVGGTPGRDSADER